MLHIEDRPWLSSINGCQSDAWVKLKLAHVGLRESVETFSFYFQLNIKPRHMYDEIFKMVWLASFWSSWSVRLRLPMLRPQQGESSAAVYWVRNVIKMVCNYDILHHESIICLAN